MTQASSAAKGCFFSRKRMTFIFPGLLGVVVLIFISAIVVVATADLRPLLERYVTGTLNRRLAIGELRIGWGSPLSVEIVDLRLANTPLSSTPEMIRIEHISAEIDAWSLLGGVFRFEKLHVMNPEIILERDSNKVRNWRFNGAATVSPVDTAAVAKPHPWHPRFPTLIDFRLHGGKIRLHTSSGVVLKIDLDEMAIRSAGENVPVSLVAKGAYNGAPVQINAETQSFSVLRDVAAPFGVEFSVSTPTAKVSFKGTMMAPLDFDGVQGLMQIDASALSDLLKTAGADIRADYPLNLAGTFERTGDHWELSDAKGELANNAVQGTLNLTEGSLGEPDDIGIAADFGQLNLNSILASNVKATSDKGRAEPNNDYGALPLRMDEKRGANFDARIKAKELLYSEMHFTDFGAHGRLASGKAEVGQLTFAFAGGTVDASGSAHSEQSGSRVVANAAVSGADSSQIAGMLGAEPGQIAGKINGRFTLEMAGETVKDALERSRGQAIVAMANGRIGRALLEKISTDLRSLFRRNVTSAPISCLIGVLDMQDGKGTLSPFRLQTPGTVVIGGGEVDFSEERLDLVIKSAAASTGVLALDIPMHVGGTFAQVRVEPAIGPSARWLDAPARNRPAHELPLKLQQLADRNPCPR